MMFVQENEVSQKLLSGHEAARHSSVHHHLMKPCCPWNKVAIFTLPFRKDPWLRLFPRPSLTTVLNHPGNSYNPSPRRRIPVPDSGNDDNKWMDAPLFVIMWELGKCYSQVIQLEYLSIPSCHSFNIFGETFICPLDSFILFPFLIAYCI